MKLTLTLALAGASLAFQGAALAQDKAVAKTAAKPAARPAAKPAAPPSLAEADGEQLLAASVTHYGHYDCEYQQVLQISKHPKADGYAVVEFAKRSYTMRPVRSITGAVRLEEVGGDMLVVQIPVKSMMMDTGKGKRIVDSCMHEEQRKEAASPAPDNSLGINSPGQISVIGTPAGPVAKRP